MGLIARWRRRGVLLDYEPREPVPWKAPAAGLALAFAAMAFLVAVTSEASDEPVERLDRRVREGIDRFNETTTEGYRHEASVGVSRCEPGDRMSLDDMLALADSAMYEEKRSKAKVVTS